MGVFCDQCLKFLRCTKLLPNFITAYMLHVTDLCIVLLYPQSCSIHYLCIVMSYYIHFLYTILLYPLTQSCYSIILYPLPLERALLYPLHLQNPTLSTIFAQSYFFQYLCTSFYLSTLNYFTLSTSFAQFYSIHYLGIILLYPLPLHNLTLSTTFTQSYSIHYLYTILLYPLPLHNPTLSTTLAPSYSIHYLGTILLYPLPLHNSTLSTSLAQSYVIHCLCIYYQHIFVLSYPLPIRLCTDLYHQLPV